MKEAHHWASLKKGQRPGRPADAPAIAQATPSCKCRTLTPRCFLKSASEVS